MRAWTEGIGPLAPMIAPVAVSTSGAHASVGWYRGANGLEEVKHLTVEARIDPSKRWVKRRVARPGHQSAWAWRWTMEDLLCELSQLLKKRRLPVSGGLLAKESA